MVTVILEYFIHYIQSECSIKVLVIVLLEYINLNEYRTWRNFGGVKYWRMHAYQSFGGNKLANHLRDHL